MKKWMEILLLVFVSAPCVWAAQSEPLMTKLDTSKKIPGLFEMEYKKGDFHTALALFAKSAGLNLRFDAVVSDEVSYSFKEKNLQEALDVLLEKQELQWRIESGVLIVGSEHSKPIQEKAGLRIEGGDGWRIFTINYPRFKRKGVGASQANVSTTASGEAGTISLTSEDEILFWDEMKEELSQIVGEKAIITINKTAGVIFLQGPQNVVLSVQRYLTSVVPSIVQQVEIVARIYEVTLNEDHSLGVDWNELSRVFEYDGMDLNLNFGTQNSVVSPSYSNPTINGSLGFNSSTGNFASVIQAMRQQGDVRAVSQPKIVTMNNQPAMVKVGTDLPYFSATVSIDSETGAREIVEQTNVVTLGIILSLTPQVSTDGWITLNIDPMVTDLVSTATSSIGSTAPIVDVKQSSSMVRLKNGETSAISGLIHTKKVNEERGVPLLSEIPFLGHLFKWSYSTDVRKELVVFLTPRLL